MTIYMVMVGANEFCAAFKTRKSAEAYVAKYASDGRDRHVVEYLLHA